MILAAHREQQVKPVAPEIDVDLVRHHRARHLDIGDEEHVLVRRAGKCDAVELAHGAARAVAAADPGRADRLAAAVGQLERRGDAVRLAARAPTSSVFHSTDMPSSRSLSPMIRSLSSWPRIEDVRIGRDRAAGVAERDARHLAGLAPRGWRRCRACRAPARARRCRASA